MRVDLAATDASEIAHALTRERHRMGSPAVGMVLTFVLVVDERHEEEAIRGAREAAREHPCRILAVVPGPAGPTGRSTGRSTGRDTSRLDAEVHIGYDAGPGETVVMRLSGSLAHHPASVVVPLLLPDAPVVAWWPAKAPAVPADARIGALAQRRVTDAAAASKCEATLVELADSYRDGDTDLAWTRTTPWRALLAATLDQPHGEVVRGSVHAARDNPSAALLAAWLADRLGVEIERKTSQGPGITAVRLKLERGEIAITRPDGRLATLSRPAQPDRRVGLHRRSTAELLVEELRWLDTDEVYGETVRRAARDLTAESSRRS